MHLDLAHKGMAIGAFQGEPLRGFYAPPVPERFDSSEFLIQRAGHSYVVKVELGSHADISNINHQIAKLAKQASKQAAVAELWKRHVLEPNAPSDVDSLTETVETVMDYVADFGPGALDLSGLNPAGVQCEHLAAVLRATSLWQDDVHGWHEALMVAQEACERAGQDAEDVLFGMV